MALRIPINVEHPEDRPLVLAAEVIQAGGVVVYPTDTLYGLGADALNPSAGNRVHMAKRRKDRKPLLILIPDRDSISLVCRETTPAARALMEAFWPGPLTLVLPASHGVPEEVTQGTGTVGVRIPSSSLCTRLMRLAGTPIVSTSANLSGEAPYQSMDEIENALRPYVDLMLDAGNLKESKPSTVVDATTDVPSLLREGAIPAATLRSVLPNLV
ncbi:MAG: L-threonylcarbamoyladenylate synthase [Bacteroidota bacterium]